MIWYWSMPKSSFISSKKTSISQRMLITFKHVWASAFRSLVTQKRARDRGSFKLFRMITILQRYSFLTRVSRTCTHTFFLGFRGCWHSWYALSGREATYSSNRCHFQPLGVVGVISQETRSQRLLLIPVVILNPRSRAAFQSGFPLYQLVF